MKLGRMLALTAMVVVGLPLRLSAFPIAAPGTEGFKLFVWNNAPVVATYLGNSAAYSDDLFLMLDGAGNPGDDGILSNDLFIFNNHSSLVGSTASLGPFTPGTELIFRMYVHDTGYNYLTGPGSRNPDGLPHARAQGNYAPNTTLVSFEDLYGTPEGVNGYNDLSFSFSNTAAESVVPEPATLLLLGTGLIGVVGAGWRRRKQAA